MNRPVRRFIYKLCGHLKKTEAELLEGPYRLTTPQLLGWMTEYEIKPFEHDDDLRFATLSTLVARSLLKSDAADLFKDFMPKRTRNDWAEAETAQSGDQVAGMLEASGMTVVRGVRAE